MILSYFYSVRNAQITTNHVQLPPRQGSGRSRPSAPNSNFGNNNKKQSVVYQYCNKSDHSAQTWYKIHGFPNKSRHPSPHAAQIVVSSYTTPPSWLLDSGASHHITNDLHNLSIKRDYNDNDYL